VFERFTELARMVMGSARDEAASLNHHYIGTEHLLLGLLREEEGLAARVLASFGVELVVVRRDVERIVGRGDEPVPPGVLLPRTPRMDDIIELSNAESETMGHPLTGTEHLLLGLVREGNGVANVILADLGVPGESIRQEIYRLLSGPH
jgi:ATP-dependent Clp protease ATP-binding subunit ClpC